MWKGNVTMGQNMKKDGSDTAKKASASIEEQLSKISGDIGGDQGREQESVDAQLEQVMQQIQQKSSKKPAGSQTAQKAEGTVKKTASPKEAASKKEPVSQDLGATRVIGEIKEEKDRKKPAEPAKGQPARQKKTEAPEAEEPEFPEERTGKAKKVIAIAACVLALLLIAGYCAGIVYYNNHFYYKTFINDIDFSNKTVSQVEESLTKEVEDYVLTLQERENMTEKIAGKEIDLKLVFDSSFQQLLKSQNPFAWITGLFKKSNYSVGSSLQYDEGKLELAMSSLKASNKVLMIAPVDASVEWNQTDGYFVNPGVVGTQIDEAVFSDAVKASVEKLEPALNMEEKNCYVPQKIGGDDQRLANAAKELNKCSQAVINYDFNGTVETCNGEIIRDWLSLGEDYSVQISAEKAREYIDTLGDKYNTYEKTRTFGTHGGGTVQITQGDYGWRMNRADMTDELVAAVREGGTQSKEPLWLQTANSISEQDWGSTYVEINLSAQHLWFYKDGSVIVESDLVSGKMSDGRATPSGIYSLKYKEKDRILRGQIQANGKPEYESFVNFWMPFNGGVGMHDASWRSSFGGSIYINSGSHGCVNLPYSKAKAIYENISSGTPIICYYSGSSYAASDSGSSSEDVSQAVPADSNGNAQQEPADEPEPEAPAPVQTETPAVSTPASETPEVNQPEAPAPDDTENTGAEQSPADSNGQPVAQE